MKLKDILKDYRSRHDLTMQEFAEKCSLSKGYISMLESGKHPSNARDLVPSLETYKKLATGMGTDLDTLLRLVDEDTVVSLDKLPENWLQFYAGGAPEDEQHKLLIQLFDQLPASSQELIIAQLKGAVQSQKAQDDQ